MYYLSLTRTPWVFWTERMGVKFFEVEHGVPDFVLPFVRGSAFWPAKTFARELWGIDASAKAQLSESGTAECLPYYSDLTRFHRGDESYAPNGELRFLFAGHYSFRKGFDTLIGAIEQLKLLCGDLKWHVTLCGDGDLKHLLTERPELEDRVTNLGFLEIAEVPGVMKRHDVFVTPSRYDGWGMVVPEALAAGMPVIATPAMGSANDVTGNPDCLRRIAPGDTNALAQAMRWFVENVQAIDELGGQAVQVASRYDSVAGSQRFTELVTRVLS
ncbi:MAG TPA: glycosyltransferase [Myxococcales bacterium]|nr:glycosyltransferase [Myxococcales bacterium]